MLNERSQSPKDKYCMIPPLRELPRIVTFTDAGRRIEGAGSWVEGEVGSQL